MGSHKEYHGYCKRDGCEGIIHLRVPDLNLGDCDCGKAYFWQEGIGWEQLDYDKELVGAVYKKEVMICNPKIGAQFNRKKVK